GSFDENGGLRITPNVEGKSDLEEVAETIFEKEQASVEVKDGYLHKVSGWMPNFEEDIDQDSKSNDELSNEGSFDENGGLRITPNVEGEIDLEEVAETIFEKEQASVEVKEGCNSVQKETVRY
ncbi:hypothetical protein Tco_1564114, partial [Tanacetum coccineum]